MKKQYTKRQISEAIKYWKNQLKQLDESRGTLASASDIHYMGPKAYLYGANEHAKDINGSMTIDQLLAIANQRDWTSILIQVGSADESLTNFQMFGAFDDTEMLNFLQDSTDFISTHTLRGPQDTKPYIKK